MTPTLLQPALHPAVVRDTTSDRVALHLREQILGGAYKVGSNLPPERALAQALGVNRVTVRSAIAALAAQKLVRVRQGSGARVNDFLDEAGPALIPAWIALARGARARTAIADLLAVRRAIAGVVLERVLDRMLGAGDARAIGRLRAALESFARAADTPTSLDELVRADLEMARALVREAQSPVLSLVMNPIAQVLGAVPGLAAAMFRTPEQNLLAWTALVDALETAREGEPRVEAMLALLAALDAQTLTHLSRRRS